MNVRSTLVIDLARERKRRVSKPLERPLVSHLLEKAEEWQGHLDRGEVLNRAELARREGISAMRVSHLLALLKLHPRIRAAIKGLPPGTPRSVISERRLRPLTRLSWERQLASLGWLVGEGAHTA
jgi:hypothetical protein